tara:strand:- start:26711 stop:27097 length:387 start_codon:yes stop_codon:yes gene_type:complete
MNYPKKILKDALFDVKQTYDLVRETASQEDLSEIKNTIDQIKIALRLIQMTEKARPVPEYKTENRIPYHKFKPLMIHQYLSNETYDEIIAYSEIDIYAIDEIANRFDMPKKLLQNRIYNYKRKKKVTI